MGFFGIERNVSGFEAVRVILERNSVVVLVGVTAAPHRLPALALGGAPRHVLVVQRSAEHARAEQRGDEEVGHQLRISGIYVHGEHASCNKVQLKFLYSGMILDVIVLTC